MAYEMALARFLPIPPGVRLFLAHKNRNKNLIVPIKNFNALLKWRGVVVLFAVALSVRRELNLH